MNTAYAYKNQSKPKVIKVSRSDRTYLQSNEHDYSRYYRAHGVLFPVCRSIFCNDVAILLISLDKYKKVVRIFLTNSLYILLNRL